MVIQSTGTSLPNLNPLSPGSSPSALSTPLSGGTGYSMADTFEAAPQRAVSGAGYGGGYGGADSANAGYSSLGAGYGTPAGGVQGAAPAGPAVSPSGDLQQQLQDISQQVGELQQCLQGAAPGGAALTNVSGDPRLLQATQEIAKDPEGAKLVQAAQAPGLQLQVGQLPPGVMGETLNGTITISPQALSNAPDLIHTLGHELGHAATPNDGDSITEEKTVDQLGQRIQQRIAPGPTFQLDVGAYRGLPQDNGILNSLAQLGL